MSHHHHLAFSVIIPTYQRGQSVCAAVDALSKATYKGELEIIVVIDGSTDGTAESLSSLACRHPLCIIEQPNCGAAAARNRGAAEATGEILLFLDDDMVCAPDLVEQHARTYDEGADAVTGEVFIHPDSPQNFLTEAVDRWIRLPRPEMPQLPFDVYTGQLSVRRSVFQHLGGFDVGFTSQGIFGHEDTDFGARLIAGYRLRHNSAAITHQLYLVGPRESMARTTAAAAADIRFLARYPQYTDHLVRQRGPERWRARLIQRPLSRVPFAAALLSYFAVAISEAAMKTRFRSNRWLRYLFFLARGVNYWAALRRMGGFPRSHSLLVLCYHAIADQSSDPVLAKYGVPPAQFAAQLQSLTLRGYTFVGADALAAYLDQQATLPRRAVLVTFDDCYEGLLDVARTFLRPRNIPAIAFMVTAVPTRSNEWDQAKGAQRLDLLRDEQLRELASLGIEIGAHSRTHRLLPELTADLKAAETAGPRHDLVAFGLKPPRFFAYPYGARDQQTMGAMKNAGYLAGFSVRNARIDRLSDPFDLPRVPVLASDTAWRFRLKTGQPKLYSWLDLNLRRASKVLAYVGIGISADAKAEERSPKDLTLGEQWVGMTDDGWRAVHRKRFAEFPFDCGNESRPGVVYNEDFRDWSDKATTLDQRRIELYVDRYDLRDKRILHIGIGNSGLALRFYRHTREIVGTTVDTPEIDVAHSHGLPNYTFVRHNKYSPWQGLVEGKFDFILDNNPTSPCCCVKHLADLFAFYNAKLAEGGQIVTDRRGLEWVPPGSNKRWGLSFEDLELVAGAAGLSVYRMTPTVYVMAKTPPVDPGVLPKSRHLARRTARFAVKLVRRGPSAALERSRLFARRLLAKRGSGARQRGPGR